MDKFDNIECEIIIRRSNINQDLKELHRLVNKDEVIRSAYIKMIKNLFLKQKEKLLTFNDINKINMDDILQAKKHIWSSKSYLNLNKKESLKEENGWNERYKYFKSALNNFDNIYSLINKLRNKNYSDIEKELEDLQKLADKDQVIRTAFKKLFS